MTQAALQEPELDASGGETPPAPRERPAEYWPPTLIPGAEIEHKLKITHAEFLILVKQKLLNRVKQRSNLGNALYPLTDLPGAEKYIRQIRDTQARARARGEAAEKARTKVTVPIVPANSNANVPYTALQSADVFKRLEAGQLTVQIVIETGMHPAVVQSIVRDWNFMRDSFNMPKDVLDAINELDLPRGRIAKPQQILQALMSLIAEKTCTKCNGSRPCARACISCIVRTYEARKKKPGVRSEEAAEAGNEDNEELTIENVSDDAPRLPAHDGSNDHDPAP